MALDPAEIINRAKNGAGSLQGVDRHFANVAPKGNFFSP